MGFIVLLFLIPIIGGFIVLVTFFGSIEFALKKKWKPSIWLLIVAVSITVAAERFVSYQNRPPPKRSIIFDVEDWSADFDDRIWRKRNEGGRTHLSIGGELTLDIGIADGKALVGKAERLWLEVHDKKIVKIETGYAPENTRLPAMYWLGREWKTAAQRSALMTGNFGGFKITIERPRDLHYWITFERELD